MVPYCEKFTLTLFSSSYTSLHAFSSVLHIWDKIQRAGKPTQWDIVNNILEANVQIIVRFIIKKLIFFMVLINFYGIIAK